jgi:hypothetical protein
VNSGGVSSSPFYSLSIHKPEGPDGPPASFWIITESDRTVTTLLLPEEC